MSDRTFQQYVSGLLTAIIHHDRVCTVASAAVCPTTGVRSLTLTDGRVLSLVGAR